MVYLQPVGIFFFMFTAKFDFILTCISGPQQPPPQALRFSHCKGERLVMNRKGPWEGYRRRERDVWARGRGRNVNYLVTPVIVLPHPPFLLRFREKKGIIFSISSHLQAENGLFFS